MRELPKQESFYRSMTFSSPPHLFDCFFQLVLQQSPIPGPYRGSIEVAQVLLLLQGGTLKRASNGACAVCVCVCLESLLQIFFIRMFGVSSNSAICWSFLFPSNDPTAFFYPIDISIAIQIDFFPPLKSDVFSQCSFNFLSCVVLYLTVHYTPNPPTRLLQAEAWP